MIVIMGKMTRSEKFLQIVMAKMKAMMQQEEKRKKRRAKTSQITKYLRVVINHQGEFDIKNITK